MSAQRGLGQRRFSSPAKSSLHIVTPAPEADIFLIGSSLRKFQKARCSRLASSNEEAQVVSGGIEPSTRGGEIKPKGTPDLIACEANSRIPWDINLSKLLSFSEETSLCILLKEPFLYIRPKGITPRFHS